MKNNFKSGFAERIFYLKYALTQADTWPERARTIVDSVCGTNGGAEHPLMAEDEREQLVDYITDFKFIPGGRYIYYSGRQAKFYNNCYLLRAEEDTREEWSDLTQRAMSCLMTGGGIGIDYSRLRPEGRMLRRTGGKSSGPIPLMKVMNEVGRNVMQGGSRRSAIYASLNWQHDDVETFLKSKNWQDMPIGGGEFNIKQAKMDDFNYPAPLDMTNISLNYDDAWLKNPLNEVFLANVKQAMSTGEPGFSFNFGDKENETLRNACTEVTSEDDSDVLRV